MSIKIGTNIRRLRKERNLSQEMLAERLGVTFQAVSRWERDEAYPDITMLPVLANFFQITVDELLGMAEQTEETDVKELVARCQECETHYKAEEMRNIIEEGLKKYPGNYTLMAWYVYAFQRVNPQKAIEVGHYILNHCTDNEIRNWVNGSIIYAYKRSGNIDKAIELAKELPSYFYSSGDVLRDLLQGKELLKHVQHMVIDIAYEFWYSIRQIRYEYSPEEQILLFKKSNDIYDAIYETDDMPVKLVRKMRNYQGMAEVSLQNNDVDSGLQYMEQAAMCAIMHDELPELVKCQAILFNQHSYDRKYEAVKDVKGELLHDFETEDMYYKDVRKSEKYANIIDKLK
ncbi:MAG: helix-turn-helix transcriptional regulator [Lachnospiraceae bacterium]|nr:helix-turn-helix transcriptional regulator [Lachnospiraceae bacterium]